MDVANFIKENKINDEKDLFNYLVTNNFKRGCTVKSEENKELIKDRNIYLEKWCFNNLESIIENKTAICWDFANFEKNIFDKIGFKSHIYYLTFDDNIIDNTAHCFTIIERDNEYILFEYSFRKNANIYKKNSINEIIEMIVNWCYEMPQFYYLKGKNVNVYKFEDVFPENINSSGLFDLAKNQEMVYPKIK